MPPPKKKAARKKKDCDCDKQEGGDIFSPLQSEVPIPDDLDTRPELRIPDGPDTWPDFRRVPEERPPMTVDEIVEHNRRAWKRYQNQAETRKRDLAQRHLENIKQGLPLEPSMEEELLAPPGPFDPQRRF
jgi:hypothetical protein